VIRRPGNAVEVSACKTANLVRREAASFRLGGLELGAQFGELGEIDRVTNGILCRGEASGGKLGLNPLGGVRG